MAHNSQVARAAVCQPWPAGEHADRERPLPADWLSCAVGAFSSGDAAWGYNKFSIPFSLRPGLSKAKEIERGTIRP